MVMKSWKRISLTVLFGGVAMVSIARDAEFENAPYMNAKLPVEQRMEDLISRMTLREKVAQLCTTAGFTQDR